MPEGTELYGKRHPSLPLALRSLSIPVQPPVMVGSHKCAWAATGAVPPGSTSMMGIT